MGGRETVGNSVGRGPLGGYVCKRRPWVDGENTVGNRLGQSSMGKERDGSDEKVDGGETAGISLGRAQAAVLKAHESAAHESGAGHEVKAKGKKRKVTDDKLFLAACADIPAGHPRSMDARATGPCGVWWPVGSLDGSE